MSQRDWVKLLRGRFVVFDGPDGSGKSTQFRRFSRYVSERGVEVCEVREPGGTYIGEQVRNILLDPQNKEEIDLRCEMLLFMASRAQLIAQRINPAVAQGQLVLADRFISSTLAYQGAAGGLPIADILKVGQVALRERWPDLVVVFDVTQATALSRMSPLLRVGEFAGHSKDRIEQRGEEYHRTVRQGYLEQVRSDPSRYLVVDSNGEPDAVFDLLLEALRQRVSDRRWPQR